MLLQKSHNKSRINTMHHESQLYKEIQNQHVILQIIESVNKAGYYIIEYVKIEDYESSLKTLREELNKQASVRNMVEGGLKWTY